MVGGAHNNNGTARRQESGDFAEQFLQICKMFDRQDTYDHIESLRNLKGFKRRVTEIKRRKSFTRQRNKFRGRINADRYGTAFCKDIAQPSGAATDVNIQR